MVSGVVSVIGDNETLVNRYAVTAEADIVLRTVKKYFHSFERETEEREYTGKRKTGYTFFYGNKKIFSHMPSHSYTNYDIITEDAVLSLHEHYPLPLRMQKSTVSEYVPVVRDYTKEEAEGIANRALERYLRYLSENETTVLSVDTKTTVGKDTIVTEGKLVLLSAAWEQMTVQDNEWRQQNSDEYSGNNDGTAGGA